MCDQTHSSQYPIHLHSFYHSPICTYGFNPSLNFIVFVVALSFSFPNLLTKYVVVVIYVYSQGMCEPHQCPIFYYRHYIQPCSPIEFNTSSTLDVGDSYSLNRKGANAVDFDSVGIKLRYCLTLFSYTVDISFIEKKYLNISLSVISIVQYSLSYDSWFSICHS